MAIKVRKIVGGLVILLLVIVLIITCVFFFWLGPTVKMVAQRIGSKALGVPLTINELVINPRHGTLHMTGFTIANQSEFGRTNAVSLAGMDIAIDVGSIFTPTVVVHRVQIDSPSFVYEQNQATDNITRFINSIQEFIGPPDPDKKPEEEQEDVSEPKVVIVEQLEINDIQFHLANTDARFLDIDVGIEQLAVSMTNGIVQLKNFHISNPSRLTTPNLFTLDSIAINVDPDTIYSDTVSIRDVQVVRPYAYLEHKPEADTVSEFMAIAQRLMNPHTNATQEAKAESPPETDSEEAPDLPPPVALHNLLVDDIQVKLLDSTSANASSEPQMLAGIGSISVKLVDGYIQIKGIRVPNPEGYQATNLFQLEGIDVSIEPETLFSGRVDITQILVDSPQINLEQTETSGNFSELRTSLMGFVPPGGAVEGAPTPEAVPQTGKRPEPIPLDEKPVVLHDLTVTNFLITLILPVATNETALIGSNLKKLRPLAKRGDVSGTNSTRRAEAPLDLVCFDVLQAQPLEGKLVIRGLDVANTHRFSNEHLVTIKQVSVDLDPDTLQSDVLVIKDILIDKPRVDYERKIATDNIKDLQTTIEQSLARRAEYEPIEPQPEPKEGAAAEAETKVIINHLLVQGGLVRAKLSALPSAPIPLPNIELKDLGKAEGGTSIGEALSKIGGTFYDSILKAISGTTGFAVDALKGVGALTLGSLEKATGLGPGETGMQAAEEPAMNAQQSPPQEKEEEAPARRHRNPFLHRRSGRAF